jgi:hypothetical protein
MNYLNHVAEERPAEPNRWSIHSRQHIKGNLALPPNSGLSSFAVETISASTGEGE